MRTLHSVAFYALVAPIMTLGAGSVLAEQSADKTKDKEMHQQSSQSDQGTMQSQDRMAQGDNKMQDKSSLPSQRYMQSAPAEGMQASELIGAEVNTTGDEEVGSVSDLIIDKNGQVVALVVGVGGFLGMGEKDVAIGWDHLTKSGTADEQELRINLTREELQSAPEYETQK
ncbi:Sporulation protein YlmC, PRC-barrel domain family [Marinobacter daqiaonensis]|uniref:Sporulation protein YlmC, PRC-barrel domain family n=1 Tax=Marinobacter daqiaonensis TaxID=650891 RepID=A0A1I6GJ86_9GAMM|nr:PRC-barrel domain-containing protein [Marinobacter daqiaonensis]SFR42230.1 Sporulation protein YlmC, PRC-barrel domain family [Marinobacter daqiaonensis]